MGFKDFLLSEGIEDKGILKAMFLAGTPGAGKSYTFRKITDGSIHPRVVNTDRFFEYYGKKSKTKLDTDENADTVWKSYEDKIYLLNKESLKNYVNSMLPLIVDGTSVSPNNLLLRVGILESFGYDTTMVYIETDLKTALKRNSERARRVPEDFIIKSHELITKSEDFYKNKFQKFFKIKNGDGEMTDDDITEAYRKVGNFYTSPVSNPIGQEIIEKLKSEKQKYLTPTIISTRELDSKLDFWYRT